MLSLLFNRRHRDCEGSSRREFLKVGSLGAGSLTLPGLLRARAEAAAAGKPVKDTSVVWLWLGGGPTHVETFDPKMTAPSEYRSTTGEESTPIPGVTVGGTFPGIARVADKMAFVRSFAHTNSGHSGGTHFVMTGYDNKQADNGGLATKPSLGSIVSRVRGASREGSGVPTYVRLGGIFADGPSFLGTGYGPFDQNGQARKNMTLTLPEDRIGDRRNLLDSLDRMNRQSDRSGLMQGLDQFEEQAFNLVFGNATKAFDTKSESPKTIERYGKGLGEQMLLARRLCEAGCGVVTLNYGGWDMHGTIAQAMKSRSPQLDQAVSAFVEDCAERGLDKNVLLVITGEFGRTPRVNKNAGRDHWAPLSTLALAGGGLRMGQVIGESASKVDVPKTQPITPQDLMATVFEVLGIDQRLHFPSPGGRPTPMIEKGRPIADLV
ncbi:MAG: DUF1501 domain-containing protein [Planctomycetota bacterium]